MMLRIRPMGVVFLSALLLAGCDATVANAGLLPATIDEAGVAKSISLMNGTAHYVFDDGRAADVMLSGRRLVNNGTGDVVFIGHDNKTAFVAGFMKQDGLPPSCYVENSPGVDRGATIELDGILWTKTTDFSPALAVSTDHAYPESTRFCFDTSGLIWGTVGA